MKGPSESTLRSKTLSSSRIRSADANRPSYSDPYAGLGFRAAHLPDLAGAASAAAADAGGLAHADRPAGVLRDGAVAAGIGARQRSGAAARLVGGVGRVLSARAFQRPAAAGGRPAKGHGDPSGQ